MNTEERENRIKEYEEQMHKYQTALLKLYIVIFFMLASIYTVLPFHWQAIIKTILYIAGGWCCIILMVFWAMRK